MRARACRLAVGSCLALLAVPAAAAEVELPVERIVLFTSGVGHFQHAGRVDGDATVEMSFKADGINDLLKSLVLEDLDGGTPAAVSYASRDPVIKTLGTFAVDLTDQPSIGKLLSRLRGEMVEIDAAAPAAGTIVGVEVRKTTDAEGTVAEKEFLTILAQDGLRTVALEGITRIKLVDPRLQAELEKALAVLALSHDNERKSVQVSFRGQGARRVRVGYVHEAPVWKTSYRLVLGEGGDGKRAAGTEREAPAAKALLQGWAIVENTTDHDWKDVRVELVSGRPISFVMDLYQPLFLRRPIVQPELSTALAPQLYGRNLAADAPEVEQLERKAGRQLRRSELADAAPAAPAARAMGGLGGYVTASAPVPDFDGIGSVQGVADGESLGNLFRYRIAEPVSLQRQRSALVPIVAEEVAVERLAIYDERVLAKHPLAGVRLKNTTALDLMQGPITVYDQAAYAGDARIDDLAAGAERLLSYAVALDVEVAPRLEGRPEEITRVRLVRGTLAVTRKLARAKSFAITNDGAEPVNLLVEHPLETGWNVVSPRPAETTRDRQRFAVAVPAAGTTGLTVVEEMPLEESFAVTGLGEDLLLVYARAAKTSPRIREALAEVIRRRQALAELDRQQQSRQQEIAAIGEEQARIRGNMERLERGSELYVRYVKKFEEQETRIETLRGEIARFAEQAATARRELEEFVAALELE
ncbi:MAG: hypothetical protein KGQ61_00585 [Planctomycetes bacterium]|nr:hypothetical protein [Planctomycetota bacterium]